MWVVHRVLHGWVLISSRYHCWSWDLPKCLHRPQGGPKMNLGPRPLTKARNGALNAIRWDFQRLAMSSSVQPTFVEWMNERRGNPGPPSGQRFSILRLKEEGTGLAVSPRVWVPGQWLFRSCLAPAVTRPGPSYVSCCSPWASGTSLSHLYTTLWARNSELCCWEPWKGRTPTHTYILKKREENGPEDHSGLLLQEKKGFSLLRKIYSQRHKAEGAWQFRFK